jgi:EAL domain-containing protein (putative c-di-GMP-specific phosphodiesterase class I)
MPMERSVLQNGGPRQADFDFDRRWVDALELVLADTSLITPSFQPIVDLARGVVAGYELLARFDHPGGESPAEWFEAAGRLDYVEQLDAVMLGIAAERLEELPPNTFLTVNVTPRGLCSPAVAQAIGEAESLEPLVVELTEQSRAHSPEALLFAVEQLRARGALIAVDDAGSGYGSLQRILRIRPEFVKLDRAFVSKIHVDEAKAAATEMIGTLASRIDAWTIAEGVERESELDRLVQLGIPLAQGFLFATPHPEMDEISTTWKIGGLEPAGSGCGIAAYIETVPAAPIGAGREQISQRFDADSALDFLPLVDDRGRPVSLMQRGALSRRSEDSRRQLMRIEPQSDCDAVLRRAITRPLRDRLTPLVCCDDEGRYRGIVRVERLIEAALD